MQYGGATIVANYFALPQNTPNSNLAWNQQYNENHPEDGVAASVASVLLKKLHSNSITSANTII